MVSDGLYRPPASHNLVTSDHSNVTFSSQGKDDEGALADEEDFFVAQNKTKSYGTHQCKKFRKEIFESHSQFCIAMASNYAHIADQKNYVEANLNLLSIDKRLKIGNVNFSCHKSELKYKAQYLADQNLRISIQVSDPEKSLAEYSK